MRYNTDNERLLPLIKREIARVASKSVGEEGNSLFDAVINTSRDDEVLESYIRMAMEGMSARMADIITPAGQGCEIDVPDFDESKASMVERTLDRYITYNTVGAWLVEKGMKASDNYASLSSAAMDNAVTLLKTRRKPFRK